MRYWPSWGGYRCEYKRRQHLLAKGPDDFPDGETYKAACKAFGNLVCEENATAAKDSNTLATIVPLYLNWLQVRRKSKTVRLRLQL